MSEVAAWARIGVAAVLLFPFAQYAVEYVVSSDSTQGLGPALAAAVIEGGLNQLAQLVTDPVHAIAYLAVLSVLWRFAFHSSEHLRYRRDRRRTSRRW